MNYSVKQLNCMVDELGMPSASHRRCPADSCYASMCSSMVCLCVSLSYPQRNWVHSLVVMCSLLLHVAL